MKHFINEFHVVYIQLEVAEGKKPLPGPEVLPPTWSPLWAPMSRGRLSPAGSDQVRCGQGASQEPPWTAAALRLASLS